MRRAVVGVLRAAEKRAQERHTGEDDGDRRLETGEDVRERNRVGDVLEVHTGKGVDAEPRDDASAEHMVSKRL